MFKNPNEFPLKPMDEITGIALEARSKEASAMAKLDPLSFTTNVPKKSKARAIISWLLLHL